jgi:outer membrane lipoprotein SlyB
VISIEPLASSSSTGASAAGSTGSSTEAAGGGAGSGGGISSGAGQAYRVTLRMDDGSTQVVSQATTPSYRSGDRVNLSGSTISR